MKNGESQFQKMPQMVVSVIIVSFNTRELTLRCLRELHDEIARAETYPCEVIVVDNASSDGSVEAIRNEFPGIRVIASTSNDGFGTANNLGMQATLGEFFLLLNSDAFLRPGAIPALVDLLRGQPEVAAAGPRLLNEDGSLQVSCYPFPSPARGWLENLWLSRIFGGVPGVGDYTQWPHDSQREVDYVIGACMLVRRSAWEQVGGFDEQFFMYAEEADWEKRMSDAGWRVVFTPAAEAMHLGGASGTSEPARINRHFFESIDWYVRKHHGQLGMLAMRAAMVLGCSLRAALWAGMWLLKPALRPHSTGKLRLHLWLIKRQALHWKSSGEQSSHRGTKADPTSVAVPEGSA